MGPICINFVVPFKSHLPNPSPHTMINVGCMYPEFFPISTNKMEQGIFEQGGTVNKGIMRNKEMITNITVPRTYVQDCSKDFKLIFSVRIL